MPTSDPKNANGGVKSRLIPRLMSWFMSPTPWILCLLTGGWLGGLIGVRPLALPDEGRYPGVAWEMLRSGEHALPLLNGMPFFHKPPLYYWLTEAAFTVFGQHAWVGRIPSWLAAWAAAWAIYIFVRRYRGACVAIAALGCLVTQPFFYGGAQFANLDMLVASMITLTILAGITSMLRRIEGEPYRGMTLATALFAALGVLSKGLIGVVLPVGILLVWTLCLRHKQKWQALWTLFWPPLPLFVFLLVGLPWFWVMQQRFPDFLHYFFVSQQFDRFTDTTFNNRQPFWFYFPVVLGLILPWTLCLGGVFRKNFLFAPRREIEQGGHIDFAYAVRTLMLIWSGVVLLFFSIPTSKLIGYMLPILPPVAVLVAEAVVAGMRQHAKKWRCYYGLCLMVAGLLCVLAVGVSVRVMPPDTRVWFRQAHTEFKAGDQLVMLHTYAYDLPIALHNPHPAWIVDDWDRQTEIRQRDNWRKELYDAGEFWPNRMQQTLISKQVLETRLCAANPQQTFWFWGDPETDVQQYSVLQGIPTYAKSATRALWRVIPDAAFKLRHCGEISKNG